MEKQNKRYSLDFKLKAVELVSQRGSLLAVSRELNVNKETLRNWKRGLYLGAANSAPFFKQTSTEEQENIQLRKELYEVKLERDILKKAVGIFSKNDR
jgi:transposase